MRNKAAACLVLAAFVLLAAAAHAATSPFGIATPDSSGGGFGGPLAPVFAWIAIQQKHFYDALSAALGALREDRTGLWLLFGLSFAYGVFHAAGPGHGKAVITSYLLASGEKARRGIALSFAAAFVQAVTAIVVVGVARLVFDATAMSMTVATNWLEIFSYGLIAVVGAWLLWTKVFGAHHHHQHFFAPEPALALAQAHDHGHAHRRDRVDEHDHLSEAVGRSLAGHAHAVPARSLFNRPLPAVLAVGIRPCSGAIIMLVFAFSQGIFLAGVAATFVMALGTGMAVAVLAVLAVTAKDFAVRLAGGRGGSVVAYRVARGVEIAGAAAVLLLGLLLLGGALQAGLPG